MYCRYCGAQNPDGALKCGACGKSMQPSAPAGPSGAPTQTVPNYLVHSILVTLFCCLPFGIVAIIYASQVNSKLIAGDYAGAVQASNNAKTWCWVSFGLGLVGVIIWLILIFAGVMSEFM